MTQPRRNGCHNRAPLSERAEVQDGWIPAMDGESRLPKMIEVPDPMTKDCQYTHTDLGQADAGCSGCTHRKENAS